MINYCVLKIQKKKEILKIMDFTCFIMQKIPPNYTNNFVKLSSE